MATGYTYPVQTGEVTEFREFAMRCARAMGALIEMRDLPGDSPIPERFEPSDYYAKRIAETEAEVERLEAMGHADVAEAAVLDFRERVAHWEERRRERAETRARYESMLAQVEAWEPPSSEHIEFKRFMRDQLAQSIDFDCGPDIAKYDQPPVPVTPELWHAAKLDAARAEVVRARESHAEEVARTEGRNRWLADLRNSLP